MRKKQHSIAYIVSMASGLEAFIYREIEALFDHGLNVVLFATKHRRGDIFSPKPAWECYDPQTLSIAIRLPLLLFGALFRPVLLWHAIRHRGLVDLLFALHFSPLMRKAEVTQIHCHFGDHKLFIGYYCKRITGLPLSVTIHAHEFYTNPNPRLFRVSLHACDHVFPIAERWLIKLRDEYGVPEDKLSLNRLFVDTNIYKPDRSVRVLAVGRFTERKGFHLLMEAVKQLTDLEVCFYFVGFGPIDLYAMAEKLGVSDRVTVFGKMDQSQLRAMYQSVDIFCLPSITTAAEGAEGIPVVLMEAMACGLPVVATRCGAVDEIVSDVLVEEYAVDQLSAGIRMLVTDPALRAEQGKKNRLTVIEKYSSKNIDRFETNLLRISGNAP